MKILLPLAAVALIAAAPEAAETPTGAAVNPPRPISPTLKNCPDAGAYHALTPYRAVPQRLIDLPPARLELTVRRSFDGCAEPAVIREGIGAPGAPEGRQPG